MTDKEMQIAHENQLLGEYILERSYIDPNETIEHPPVAISCGTYDIETKDEVTTYPLPLATYGNFSFIQAPPKHKKTFLVTLLSTAYLGGDTTFSKHLKGHRGDRCVLHFDTEQGRFHAQRVFKRPLEMTGLTNECYHTFGLRSFSHEERLCAIEYAIYSYKNVGLVIIDGIADLVSDVNNIDESNRVVGKIMKWSEEMNCHIITVIHTNYNTNKPTGHLGSALEKKTETQIQISGVENSNLMEVSCRSSRGRGFAPFNFYINRYGLPVVSDFDIDIEL